MGDKSTDKWQWKGNVEREGSATFRTKNDFSYKYTLVLQFSKSSLGKEKQDSNTGTTSFVTWGKSQSQ